MPLSNINSEDYQAFRRFLEEACGILLGDNKHYLVQSRLGGLVQSQGLSSLGELVHALRRAPPGSRLREQVIEAMTTNETLWFRDRHPFEILEKTVLPALAAQGLRNPRVWSAACSTGQEPYSISMTVQQYLAANPGKLRDVGIVATDISPRVLTEAREGFYDSLALSRGLPRPLRDRYFRRDAAHWEERWQVADEIRRRVRFTVANLQESYARLGRFEVIFCRNVLIYFSAETKRDILARMADTLADRGWLFLGASESLSNHSNAFEMVRAEGGVVYRKRG
ncbi:MAG TPA: protein-glutamate O-methyltransferase CheR [Gammaproteobacteria bacterium]|nr:protein-glutamate O-methyltransferase CheR [Gammaproteobacteria bacterium]